MQISCTPCRIKKCKCDRTKPNCSQCQIRKKDCFYGSEDKRKRSHKEFEELQQISNAQAEMINSISKGGKKAETIINRLQGDDSPYGNSTKDPEIDLRNDLLSTDERGKITYYGDTSNIHIMGNSHIKSDDKISPPSLISRAAISDDLSMELWSLYFCWQQTYFNIFDRSLFLRDMYEGGPFYSDFLFNSILAHAAHISERQDAVPARDIFYRNALEMIPQELEVASITTVQGLLLLASKESGMGKVNLGWIHSGMAFRICIDLGLQLDTSGSKQRRLVSEEEERVRIATFWGCYIFDRGWSFYLGRPAAIHESSITLKFPSFTEESPVDWSPFYESISEPSFTVDYYPHNTLVAIIHIYRLLQDIITDIYSPGNDKSYGILLEQHYQDLKNWSEKLPKCLELVEKEIHPAVIMLHTMYHSAIIFLFRPYVKLGGQNWSHKDIPDPVDISYRSALSILDLLQRYKQLYDFRKIINMASYVISTVAAVLMILTKVEDLEICRDMLSELRISWPGSEHVLARINYRTKETTNQPTLSSPFGVPSNAFNLDNFMLDYETSVDWSLFYDP